MGSSLTWDISFNLKKKKKEKKEALQAKSVPHMIHEVLQSYLHEARVIVHIGTIQHGVWTQ